VHLVVFIAYILIVSVTRCCIHCIHIFSSSAASVIIKFSVQCSATGERVIRKVSWGCCTEVGVLTPTGG